MDELVEILLCEGGDVELGARTSKHILVFAFDPLSLTLSLIYLALIHIVISYTCFVCLCAILVLTKKASYSTSTLIQRTQEELVQSPSLGEFGYTLWLH